MLFYLASLFFLLGNAQDPAAPTFAPFAAAFQLKIYGFSPDGPFVESVVGQQWWEPGRLKFSSSDYRCGKNLRQGRRKVSQEERLIFLRGLVRQLSIQVSPGHVNTTYVFFEEEDTRLSRCGPAPDNSSPYTTIPSGSFISQSGAAFLYYDTIDGQVATVWKGKGTAHLAWTSISSF
jgi:hypothetical protein